MTPAYTFRIMACLPDHSPVELFRACRKYAQADWNFWTRDLDPAWTCWVEHRLSDKHTLTPRLKPWKHANDRTNRMPLTVEEKAGIPGYVAHDFNP